MNAISIREAMGSAATSRATGNAMPRISEPSVSNLKMLLESHFGTKN